MYLNETAISKTQELEEVALSVVAAGGLAATMIAGLIKAGVDYIFASDKINFKNRIKAVRATFGRKKLPESYESFLKKYSPSTYGKKGIFGVWSNMRLSEMFDEPSIFVTLKLREKLELSGSDIVVGRAEGNSKSYFVLASDNKIYLVTKVSRVKKFDNFSDLLTNYYKL